MSWRQGAILVALAVAGLASAEPPQVPATTARVEEHGLARRFVGGEPEGVSSSFVEDETVHAWVRLSAGGASHELRWQFQGPTGRTFDAWAVANGGGTYEGTLELSPLPDEKAHGAWTVRLDIDGQTAYTDAFTVTDFTGGLVWWGPFVGLALLLIFVATIGGGLFLLVRRWFPRQQ